MKPRAYIGYLIEYNLRNIYHIQIPTKDKVIRTYNVTFNKNTFYKPNDVDEALVEQEFYKTVQILQEIPENILAYNQNLEEIKISSMTDIISILLITIRDSD